MNFSRFDDADRKDLFEYVSRLVRLRTSHQALSVDETHFIHADFDAGKRVLAWTGGEDSDPVVAVGNFSEFTTPDALSPGAEYRVPNWPETPADHHWFEVTQQRHVKIGRHNRESIFAWEAKVYRLEPGASA